jgi:NAD-dependent SIR2 family protein deacetylase
MAVVARRLRPAVAAFPRAIRPASAAAYGTVNRSAPPRRDAELADDAAALAEFLGSVPRDRGVVVLTGAGLSTDSGLPDYRGKAGAMRRKGGYKPMTLQSFLGAEFARQRYWARSMVGWPVMRSARPNVGHEWIRSYQMETGGVVITQNVDGLHEKEDSGVLVPHVRRPVVELHGSVHSVVCMSCSSRASRNEFQDRLLSANTAFMEAQGLVWQGSSLSGGFVRQPAGASSSESGDTRPDGDIAIDDLDFSMMQVPTCSTCQTGVLRPAVVLFGDNLEAPVAAQARDAVAHAGALLVLGTTLSTLSAFRLVRQAAEQQTPIAMVNQGESRADKEGIPFTLRIDSELAPLLSRVSL